MAKGYRTDVVSKGVSRRNPAKAPKPERCPLAGCESTSEMYSYMPSNREGNLATLQRRLKREHPDHTSEVRISESAEMKQCARQRRLSDPSSLSALAGLIAQVSYCAQAYACDICTHMGRYSEQIHAEN
jgi:hypothetical protein